MPYKVGIPIALAFVVNCFYKPVVHFAYVRVAVGVDYKIEVYQIGLQLFLEVEGKPDYFFVEIFFIKEDSAAAGGAEIVFAA